MILSVQHLRYIGEREHMRWWMAGVLLFGFQIETADSQHGQTAWSAETDRTEDGDPKRGWRRQRWPGWADRQPQAEGMAQRPHAASHHNTESHLQVDQADTFLTHALRTDGLRFMRLHSIWTEYISVYFQSL